MAYPTKAFQQAFQSSLDQSHKNSILQSIGAICSVTKAIVTAYQIVHPERVDGTDEVSHKNKLISEQLERFILGRSSINVDTAWMLGVLFYPYWVNCRDKMMDRNDNLSKWISDSGMKLTIGDHIPVEFRGGKVFDMTLWIGDILLMASTMAWEYEEKNIKLAEQYKDGQIPEHEKIEDNSIVNFDKVRLSIYRIFYNMIPVFKAIDPIKDDHPGDIKIDDKSADNTGRPLTRDEIYAGYKQALEASIGDIRKTIDNPVGGSSSSLAGFASRILSSFGINLPGMDNLPTDDTLESTIKNGFTGAGGLGDALSKFVSGLSNCKSAADVVNLFQEGMKDPQVAAKLNEFTPGLSEKIEKMAGVAGKVLPQVAPALQEEAKQAGLIGEGPFINPDTLQRVSTTLQDVKDGKTNIGQALGSFMPPSSDQSGVGIVPE